MLQFKKLLDFDKTCLDRNKHKRILYAGIRRENGPVLTEFLYEGSQRTFQKDIEEVGMFPTILVWETESGDTRYGEVINA